jgi:GDPmannose 4,6-dehydratase
LGDPTKAKSVLGWKPTITLSEMIKEMVACDRDNAAKEAILRKQGFNIVGSMESPPSIKI